MVKTNAEMCKNYYNRKKAAKIAEKIRQGLSVEKPVKKPVEKPVKKPVEKPLKKKKTGAEYTRACRLRKKLRLLSQVNESSVTEILSIPSTSNSRIRTFEPSFQLATTSASTNRPDVSTVSSTGIADHDDTENVIHLQHSNISCSACGGPICGSRYSCVSCTDYDLCVGCEAAGIHSHHLMLRIANPLSSEHNTLVRHWCKRLSEDLKIATYSDICVKEEKPIKMEPLDEMPVEDEYQASTTVYTHNANSPSLPADGTVDIDIVKTELEEAPDLECISLQHQGLMEQAIKMEEVDPLL